MENYFSKDVGNSPAGLQKKEGLTKNSQGRKAVINDSLVIQDRGSQHLMSIDWTKPIYNYQQSASESNANPKNNDDNKRHEQVKEQPTTNKSKSKSQ